MPPLLPVFGELAEGLRRKRSVRSFFWKTIPEAQVKGRSNLWTQGGEQPQHQIDVSAVEELFGQGDCQSEAKATPTRTGAMRRAFRETRDEVFILDSKRGMNVGIFLKQLRRTNQLIINDICHGNSRPYGAEPLRELLKLLPESEEVRKLRSYQDDVSKLSLADSFMHLLIQVPSYSLRVQAMLLREEFPVLSATMRRDITTLRAAAREVRSCEELHQVLHLVLQAGNILNAGRHTGQAVGFKLSSLLSLADTKANKPGMSLLHFVALEAQKLDAGLLNLPLKLTQLASAARISMETLDADLKSLRSRVISLEENIQKEAELLEQQNDFLQDTSSCLGALCGCWQQLRQEGGELADFFCEDQQSFRLDDCFSTLHSFCSRFRAAVQENQEREVKEAAHRRRIQEQEELKRHSWAGGEQVGGALGWRCSSETDVWATRSRPDRAALLVELLSAKPRPPGRQRTSSSSSPPHAAGRRSTTGTAAPAHRVPPGTGPETAPPQSCDFSPRDRPRATSDTQQSRDHQASGEPTEDRASKEEDEGSDEGGAPGRSEDAAAAGLSVVVEKRTLVPQLRVFEHLLHAGAARGRHRDHAPILDLEEDPEKVRSSSSQQEEQEEQEEEGRVSVWCVTGVCEAAGERSDSAHAGTGKNQLSGERQGASAGSSGAANHSPPSPQPANEEPASPGPISSQPAPVGGHLSNPRGRRPPSTGAPGGEPAGLSANHRRPCVGDQSTKDGGGPRTPRPLTNEKTGAASHLSKRTSRKLLPVRVLSQSEHQALRRVLPIGTSPRPRQQNQQRASGTQADPHRAQRPSSAPGGPRSSEEQERPLTGSAGARARGQEEKVCRSTLRALGGGAGAGGAAAGKGGGAGGGAAGKGGGAGGGAAGKGGGAGGKRGGAGGAAAAAGEAAGKGGRAGGGAGGGGGAAGAAGASAPTTPACKAPPATPTFAQSTASSSFRRSTLAPPRSSLKSAPSSVASFGSSSSLTQTGSLRAPATSDPAAAPQGQRRDKRAAAGRSARPAWR